MIGEACALSALGPELLRVALDVTTVCFGVQF